MTNQEITNSKNQILQTISEIANYSGLRIQAAMTIRHSFTSSDDKPLYEMAYQQADTKMNEAFKSAKDQLDKLIEALTKIEEDSAEAERER